MGTNVRSTGRLLFVSAAALLLAGGAFGSVKAPAAPAPRSGKDAAGLAANRSVAVIEVHGEINQVLAASFLRRFDTALAAKPQIVILDMDTWGGELHSAYEIAHRVRKAPEGVRMVAFISEKAISAGALISLACDEIAMRPGTILGDCEAILVAGGEIKTAPEKIKTTLRATFEDFAEAAGYSPDLAVAMVDKEHEVVRVLLAEEGADLSTDEGQAAAKERAKVLYVQRRKLDQWPIERKERVIEETTQVFKGNLLTMNHTQATELGFCRRVVADRAELTQALEKEAGASLTVQEYTESGWEVFIGFLTSGPMRALLMFVGVLGLMIEFYHPGMLVPGAVGLVCLGIAFFSGHLIGAVDFVDIGLIVLGVGLLLVEVFLIPGFGVVGILGIISLLIGCFLSLQSFTIPSTTWETQVFRQNLEAFFLGICGTTIGFGIAVRFLPQSPFLRRIVLTQSQKVEDGYSVGSPSRVALLGRKGRTATPLRPAGKIEIGDTQYDAVSEGGFLERGQVVVVLRTEANHVVVGPAEDGGAA